LAFEALVEAIKVKREEDAELLALAVDTESSLLFVRLMLIVRKELVDDDIALLLKDRPRC
jgi:hypothetical protein